jgi:RNA polymerase sigma factor (sigma-70 family)
MEKSDEELIADCRAGDAAAWENLVRRYQRVIYAIPRRAGFDEEMSGEVFQQVFTLLVENLDRIKQPAQIQAWLVTTARRETIRLLRQPKPRQMEAVVAGTEDAVDEVTNLADPMPLPDEVLLQMEMQNRVRLAVQSLDEKCRKLVEMLFYRETPPPYSEIARVLGISEGSIGPMRARCLQKAINSLNK